MFNNYINFILLLITNSWIVEDLNKLKRGKVDFIKWFHAIVDLDLREGIQSSL